jgi:hypothetical protein
MQFSCHCEPPSIFSAGYRSNESTSIGSQPHYHTAHDASQVEILQRRPKQPLSSAAPLSTGTDVVVAGNNQCPAGGNVIDLANKTFGPNGWSSAIKAIRVDFVDEHVGSKRVSLVISAIVRVTLKDGIYQEGVGYGQMENCERKGAAFAQAKKQATADALARAIQMFGTSRIEEDSGQTVFLLFEANLFNEI